MNYQQYYFSGWTIWLRVDSRWVIEVVNMAFSFERLEVYQRALNWVDTIECLCSALKGRVSYSLLDQLQRAALSIPLNIAESNGRWHKGEKRQFFWFARGSVFECVPIIQVLYRKSLINESTYQSCYEELDILSKMLTNLVKSVDGLRAFQDEKKDVTNEKPVL